MLGAFSVIMMHLSRLSEELILWASQEFRYVDLPDTFCTGEQHDAAKEESRCAGAGARQDGASVRSSHGDADTAQGVALSYNRDLQEDKEALFDAVDTTEQSLMLCTELMRRLVVNTRVLAEAAEGGGMLATELADHLVTKGPVPGSPFHYRTDCAILTGAAASTANNSP